MNEMDVLNIIKSKADNEYIGDDCALLSDIGIVVSQDSLVEDIHFKLDWCTPFQLGYKSASVNISDILASGALPSYLTIALSIPNKFNENFIEQFYDGVNQALNGVDIVGGDITGSSDKLMISIAAIGKVHDRNISSRKNAKPDYVVITKGMHGSSAAGLSELKRGISNGSLIKAHLEPQLEYEFSNQIATKVKEPYAMMDTSDGLADALFKIAEASNVKITVDYDLIPHFPSVTKEQVLYGGEDYKLVAAIPKNYVKQIHDAVIIGKVDNYDGVRLEVSGQKYTKYRELRVYNHFGDNND